MSRRSVVTALIMAGVVIVAAFGRRAGWWLSAREADHPNSYVDAARCEACHAATHRDYQHVGMARSFSSAVHAPPIENYEHAPSGRHYQVLQRGNRFFQRRYELDSNQREVNAFELEVTHSIGSGNHAHTYLHRSETGELTELPLTWYTQEKRWGMSPGFDNATPPDFTRVADESCLFCHNGYPSANGALAEGIDCQRCHGPGSRHVELASGGKVERGEIQAAIVNPARLSAELQMDVCMQCHLETTSAELPQMIRRFEREPFSFRPGKPLGDYMVHFDKAPGSGDGDRFEIVNQAYRLRQSACFLKSGGKLTCTTCHDPHNVPRGTAAVLNYRAKCLTCHAQVGAANHPDVRSADCASCHMLRRRPEDAVHVVMTDHLIRRRPPARDPGKPLAEGSSTYRGPLAVYYPTNLSEGDRNLYLGVALVTGSADRRLGIGMLEKALQQRDEPAKAIAVLGEGYLAEGETERAIEMFRRAVEKDPSLAKAQYNLGRALEAAGRTGEARSKYEEAIRVHVPFPEAEYALATLMAKTGEPALATAHYQKAIQARSAYAEAHSNLGNLYADQGRFDEARTELEEALRVNPAFAEAHNSLARVLAGQKRIPEALDHARRAVALNGNNAEAHYNLGQLLQETGAIDAAMLEYRRALALTPALAEAHLSLGQALGDAGRLDEAVAEFREVLRLRPGHTEAQRNLDMALSMKSKGVR